MQLLFINGDFKFKSFQIQGSNNPKKETPPSTSNQRTRFDPITSRNNSRGFGLPQPSKFKNGVVPISQVLPRDDTNSTSEDMSSDSEGEVYGGRYSVDSSPHDDRVPSGSSNRHRDHDPVKRGPQYHVYSSDVSSSIEMRKVSDRLLMRGGDRYNVRSSVYTEDESDDSRSSEFSSTQVGASMENLPHKDSYVSDGYSSYVSSHVNGDTSSRKVQF